MPKVITSTDLKQKTRKILNMIEKNPDEPVFVETYKQPKVVILSYKVWKDVDFNSKKIPLKNLRKYFVKTKQKIDSSKILKKMRDE